MINIHHLLLISFKIYKKHLVKINKIMNKDNHWMDHVIIIIKFRVIRIIPPHPRKKTNYKQILSKPVRFSLLIMNVYLISNQVYLKIVLCK